MLVADGMGGHEHGDLAAQLAVQHITQAFQRAAQPALADPPLFLSKALTDAHYAIIDDSFERHLNEAPRTTIVACVIQDGQAWWAHAGDSRLYLVRNRKLLTRTRDHSRLQLMLDQGLVSPEEAATHPGRNRIYSCLGGSHTPQIDYSLPHLLRDGDIFALCSDGLWGPLEESDLIARLSSMPLAQAVPVLLDRAELDSAGTSDNLSLLAMCWHSSPGSVPNDSISTRTMALDAFATQMDVGTASSTRVVDLDEDEIERAIREINDAISKFDKR